MRVLTRDIYLISRTLEERYKINMISLRVGDAAECIMKLRDETDEILLWLNGYDFLKKILERKVSEKRLF